jgi:hypothetical protein
MNYDVLYHVVWLLVLWFEFNLAVVVCLVPARSQ